MKFGWRRAAGDDPDLDFVDLRLTEEFRAAQNDESFLAWQEMHETGWEIGFYDDWADAVFWDEDALFELEQPLTREGLGEIERKTLDFFPPERSRPSDMPEDDFRAAMHVAWYVGRVFIETFAGRWAAGPRTAAGPRYFVSAADLPHTTGFLDPVALFELATQRRTGQEWSRVHDHHHSLHQSWRAAGGPERALTGTSPAELGGPGFRPREIGLVFVKKRASTPVGPGETWLVKN